MWDEVGVRVYSLGTHLASGSLERCAESMRRILRKVLEGGQGSDPGTWVLLQPCGVWVWV